MIIIQSRTGSTRLPRKAMAEIGNIPLLQHCVDQCCASTLPVMVAIPVADPLGKWLADRNIPYFEGSEKDVLRRYYDCAVAHKMQWVARVTGDCPLISPANILYVIHVGMFGNADFVSNAFHACVDGQEVEYMSMRMLEKCHRSATSPLDREHVTTWIKDNHKNLKDYAIASIKDIYPVDTLPKMSVDTHADLATVTSLYEEIVERDRLWK